MKEIVREEYDEKQWIMNETGPSSNEFHSEKEKSSLMYVRRVQHDYRAGLELLFCDNQPGLAAPAAGCPPKAPNPAAARKCHTTTIELIRSKESGAKKQ